METVSNTTTQIKEVVKKNLTSSTMCKAVMGVGIFVLVVGVFIIIYILTKFGRNKSKFVDPEVTTVALPRTYRKALRNYYIKASYNSCAAGEFANDWVDYDALKHAIKYGCRWLDFEIYDIGGEPHVAVSNSVKFTAKSCYNSLPLGEVFKTIKDNAYPASNGHDPLFLSFRIKCEHTPVFEKIAELLQINFAERLLGNAFSYEFGGKNLGAVPLIMLANKVIVAVDLSNVKVKESKLIEFVNLGLNSAFNRVLQYTEVGYNPPSDLAEFAKKNVTECVPDLSSSSSNYDSSVPFNYGIQVAAMCFQTHDDNLRLYNAKFDKSAFLEKPIEMQYVVATVEEAPPLPADVNYSEIVTMVKAGPFSPEISIR